MRCPWSDRRSGKCFYCTQGHSSRCKYGQIFGTEGLDGAQAQFVGAFTLACLFCIDAGQVRVPLASTTLMKAPERIADQALVLMADIFPTGYFGVSNALKDMTQEQIGEATVVVIGCGFVLSYVL